MKFSYPYISEWENFPNFCVSSDNVDRLQTKWTAGNGGVESCKRECNLKPKCSAIEWYDSQWGGSECHLMLGDVPSVKGSDGARYNGSDDAICYIKPTPQGKNIFGI